MAPRVLLFIVMALLTTCGAAEGNLDDGFYYLTVPGGGWVVAELPPREDWKNVKSITVSKEDGELHTLTSIDMGTYVIMCHEQKRTCKEIRPILATPWNDTDQQ